MWLVALAATGYLAGLGGFLVFGAARAMLMCASSFGPRVDNKRISRAFRISGGPSREELA